MWLQKRTLLGTPSCCATFRAVFKDSSVNACEKSLVEVRKGTPRHQCQYPEQSSHGSFKLVSGPGLYSPVLGPVRTWRRRRHIYWVCAESTRSQFRFLFACLERKDHSCSGLDLGSGVFLGFRMNQYAPVRPSLSISVPPPFHPSRPLFLPASLSSVDTPKVPLLNGHFVYSQL